MCLWILAHRVSLGIKRKSKFFPSSPLYQQLLSYLRYLLHHKFNPVSEPFTLLSEEKGAPKPLAQP